MSSREPLWYCHQCNAEMRPLMMPDPVCASCRGPFVEKMENPQDDPREFHQHGDGGLETAPEGIEPFLMALQNILDSRPRARRTPETRERNEPNLPGVAFQIRTNSGTRSVAFGGPNTLHQGTDGRHPTMSEFLRREPGDGITGPLMAQYLMALLGRDPMNDLFPGGDAAGRGRMGDYVFNQEALDQIITQLMESSNTNRPVPATQNIIDELPREVLESGSSTLEKDCAVCKEQFKTETDDPDEQIVITLPCKHPFHEPCILPWLKSSGTCPVCRHALVPQPSQHPTTVPSEGSSTGGSTGTDSGPSESGGGLFQSLFGLVNNSNTSSAERRNSAPSSRSGAQRRRSSDQHVPGRWEDELD